jgi:hypothetical protein
MGNGAFSGVGITSDSPYTEPVDEKTNFFTPATRAASSIF